MHYSIIEATIYTYLNLNSDKIEKLLVADKLQIPELFSNSTSQQVSEYNRLLTFYAQEHNALVFTRDELKSKYEALNKMSDVWWDTTRQEVLKELFEAMENMLPDMDYYDDSIKGF